MPAKVGTRWPRDRAGLGRCGNKTPKLGALVAMSEEAQPAGEAWAERGAAGACWGEKPRRRENRTVLQGKTTASPRFVALARGGLSPPWKTALAARQGTKGGLKPLLKITLY